MIFNGALRRYHDSLIISFLGTSAEIEIVKFLLSISLPNTCTLLFMWDRQLFYFRLQTFRARFTPPQ